MIKVIIYTVCFVVVVGLTLYGINKLYQWGWTGGYSTADAAWKAKATDALNKKVANIKEFGNLIQQRALDHKDEIDELDKEHTKEMGLAQLGKDMAIAAVLDGTVKLHEPFNPERIGRGSHCDGTSDETSAGVCAPVDHAEEARELHPKTAAFLFELTLEADRNTEQLGKCQDAVEILQKGCGEQNASSTD